MKTFFHWWAPVVILLFLIACKKDESIEAGGKVPASSSYIRCKIDGVDRTFNFNTAVSKQDLGAGMISYTIAGKAVNDPANLEGINIGLQVADSLQAGTYSEIDPSATYILAAVFNPNTTEPTKIFATAMDSINPFQLTLHVVNDSLMTGSFKGKLMVNSLDSNQATAVITDGDFKVKVQ